MRTATTATVTMTMIPPQRKATNNNFDSFQYNIRIIRQLACQKCNYFSFKFGKLKIKQKSKAVMAVDKPRIH